MKAKPVMRIGKFATAVSLAILLASASYGSAAMLQHLGAHPAAVSADGPGTNGWG
jgi:hypothetical protein